MLLSNPIILKELIQGGHRKRTYLIRMALPAVAAAVLGFQLYTAFQFQEMNWRSVSEIARPIFVTCSWIQMIAFPLTAAAFAASTLAREWTDKTVEVLCATPLSAAKIIYGKFASVLAKIFLLGLALLPIQGIYVQLGRVPPGAVLKALGLIAATTLLFGSLSLLDSTGLATRKRRTGGRADAILIYFLLTVIPAAFLWERYPLLVAAVPFWAFYYVLTGGAPVAGMSPAGFATAAIAIPAVISVAALGVSPAVFRWAFSRHMGASGSGKRRRFGGVLGRRAARRPPLRPRQHPLYWQETGPNTRLLRWALPAIYVCAVVTVLIVATFHREVDYDTIVQPEFYQTLAVVGACVCTLLSALFAARVFSREKVTRTAQSLVLTGIAPRVFFHQKLKVILFAQRYAFIALAICLGLFLVTERYVDDEDVLGVIGIAVSTILGVFCAAVPVLVVSAAGRSPSQTTGAVFLSFGLCWAFYMMCWPILWLLGQGGLYAIPVAAAVLIVVVMKSARSWTAWRLSVMLALSIVLFVSVLGLSMYALVDLDSEAGTFAYTWAFPVVHAIAWYVLGVRIFDKCLLGEGARSGR